MVERISAPTDQRAALYRALGEPRRLAIVDALQLSDRSVGELGQLTGLPTNLLAFHLRALEDAGAITRTVSEGDARRRYVTLHPSVLPLLGDPPPPPSPTTDHVLFVCTANSARSQLAARLWQARTGGPALSAGTDPAPRVHPHALTVAERHGLDLGDAAPVDYRSVEVDPDLVVSVCDRVHEDGIDLGAPALHWSVPDPAPHGKGAFEDAFARLAARIDRLALAA